MEHFQLLCFCTIYHRVNLEPAYSGDVLSLTISKTPSRDIAVLHSMSVVKCDVSSASSQIDSTSLSRLRAYYDRNVVTLPALFKT